MRGDFDEARRLYAKARITLEEMGRSVIASSTSLDSCGVEMLAGDPAAAERELRRDFEALSAMGERYVLSTVAVELARAVGAQGRQEEALGLTRVRFDPDVGWPYCGLVSMVVIVQFGELNALNTSAMASSET